MYTYRAKLGKTVKPKPRKVDWSQADWSKNNTELARDLGLAYDTVAKKRWELGAPAAASKAKRKDIGTKKPQCAPHSNAGQIMATEAAKLSPLAGKFASNVQAVDWWLISPDGTEYKFKNLYEFVRQNPHLFAPADTVFKRTGGKRGTGGEYCNATAGLLNVKAGKAKAWKRWTLKPSTSNYNQPD
ncbi:hypothetical protein E2B99_13645 [Alkanindiges illinoisensis]|uniref:Uncharacterized protein n=1 Tax=Alkanindiges illinoisensis TaxID=197183 RepID=A0A4Y7X9D5_9GAMM|nr:hypothetical protein E2B99_13645 [Alkanindiges illinoisensis]